MSQIDFINQGQTFGSFKVKNVDNRAQLIELMKKSIVYQSRYWFIRKN